MSKITKLTINKFRALENLEINIGSRLTVICGKNGTSKSTILGMIAHSFNFQDNYTTIYNKKFTSKFSEHFKLSEKYDPPGTMDVKLNFDDHINKQNITATLEMGNYIAQNRKHRIVVRQYIENKKSKDSKIEHPVIFLSLKRLIPMAERKNLKKVNFTYFDTDLHKNEFQKLINRIFITNIYEYSSSSSSQEIESSVAHGRNYDYESVSVGEDNLGQIITALLSFEKLKKEYVNYNGGVLLIDEIDAGLFPAAQKELMSVLNEYATKLDLQIIVTSHSPIIIEETISLEKKSKGKNKIIYITNSYGRPEVKEDWNWDDIECDINVIIKNKDNKNFPKVNVYVEDEEAAQLFNELLYRNKIKKYFNVKFIKGAGCRTYLNLVENIDYFKKKIILILDGDLLDEEEKEITISNKKHPNVFTLPTTLPPDQLLFFILHNIEEDNCFWKKYPNMVKQIFYKESNKIAGKINLKSNKITIQEFNKLISNYRELWNNTPKGERGDRVRVLFKDFYKKDNIQELIKRTRPFVYYFDLHQNKKEYFIKQLKDKYKKITGIDI